MPAPSVAIVLAVLAAVLVVIALILLYLSLGKRRKAEARRLAEEAERDAKDQGWSDRRQLRERSSGQGVTRGVREIKKKPVIEKSQRYLFVMFDEPGPETNRALGELLKRTNAFFEADVGVYHLPRGPEGYPLTVANAFSPGTLPPLHKSGEHEPVKGISVLIKFLHAKRIAHRPETLINFVHAAAALGGHVLDFDRKPVTEETFELLRHEAEASST
jgi:hypothetical protein